MEHVIGEFFLTRCVYNSQLDIYILNKAGANVDGSSDKYKMAVGSTDQKSLE